jgi:hypothetical protein
VWICWDTATPLFASRLLGFSPSWVQSGFSAMPRLSVGAGVRTACRVPQHSQFHIAFFPRTLFLRSLVLRHQLHICLVSLRLCLCPCSCLSFHSALPVYMCISLTLALPVCTNTPSLYSVCPFTTIFVSLAEAVPLSRLRLLPPKPFHVVLPCLSVRYALVFVNQPVSTGGRAEFDVDTCEDAIDIRANVAF